MALPAYKFIQTHPPVVVTSELRSGEDSQRRVAKFPTSLQAELRLDPLCSHRFKHFCAAIPTLFLQPGVVDSGPECVNNALLACGRPRARDFKTLLIQPREEQFQHGISPPYAEEQLKLVERMATMRVALLCQVSPHYRRDLAR
jgi:hypothetical protein